MDLTLLPDRLIEIREARGLNKAEAARLLGLSKMGYLRYETADRTPSTPSGQTLVFIAQKLGTSPEYLAGLTDDPLPREILISQSSDPELFEFVKNLMEMDDSTRNRLLAYFHRIKKSDQ